MILVTGSTGNVGRHVVSGLLERGVEVRALTRHPDEAGFPADVDVARGDLSNPEGLVDHLDGVDTVFLLWPFLTAERAASTVRTLAGVAPRIVYLSAEAAARRPDSSWALVEQAIESEASEWVFLRPTGFAANTLMWADQIRKGDVVRWVYGRAGRSLIDERDIAAVAVLALTEERHAGERYILTGPAVVTQAEQVRTIGDVLGRRLRWEEVPREATQAQLGDVPDTALDTWASFVTTPEIVTSTVHELTRTPARSFGEWASYHAEDFR